MVGRRTEHLGRRAPSASVVVGDEQEGDAPMQLFECQQCGQFLYFENTRCEHCGHSLGYLPELSVLSALLPEGDGTWRPLAAPDRPSRFCANVTHAARN